MRARARSHRTAANTSARSARPSPTCRTVPDSKTRSQLQSIANGGRVEPIVETKIRRTTRALKTQSGEHIELALDSGEIRTLANGRSVVPVSEIELELKHGSPIALYQAARKLCHAAPLTISTESKVERGLRALEGRDIGAQKAGRMELARGLRGGGGVPRHAEPLPAPHRAQHGARSRKRAIPKASTRSAWACGVCARRCPPSAMRSVSPALEAVARARQDACRCLRRNARARRVRAGTAGADRGAVEQAAGICRNCGLRWTRSAASAGTAPSSSSARTSSPASCSTLRWRSKRASGATAQRARSSTNSCARRVRSAQSRSRSV